MARDVQRHLAQCSLVDPGTTETRRRDKLRAVYGGERLEQAGFVDSASIEQHLLDSDFAVPRMVKRRSVLPFGDPPVSKQMLSDSLVRRAMARGHLPTLTRFPRKVGAKNNHRQPATTKTRIDGR